MMKRFLAILLLLAGCSPVVQDTITREKNVWQLLRQVKVQQLDDVTGQLLQQTLAANFNSLQKKAPHNYDLRVSFTTSDIELVGRNLYQMQASFTLYRAKTDEVLHQSTALQQSRYGILGSDYQQEKSRKAAEKRAIRQLARQIVFDIQNYFIAEIKRDDL
ncbi:MAG: hypothetical protein K0U39_05240 [Alphaproteobacteria bacterium]|nr:hypothetical protein [Alphaproteobacteria bacterium]